MAQSELKGIMEDLESALGGRPLLQRRNTLSNVFQSLVDAFLVLAFFVLLIVLSVGSISTHHVIFGLILIGAMAICYDFLGIYRKNKSLFGKAFDLLLAWFSSLMVGVVALYFILSSQYLSGSFLAVFSVGGYLLQFFSYILFFLYKKSKSKKSKVSALIIGGGDFAQNLKVKINSNPWVREYVVCTVEGLSGGESDIDDFFDLIDRKSIKSIFFAVSMRQASEIQLIYDELMNRNLDVHWVPNFESLKLINPSVKELSGMPIMTLSETPLLGTHYLKKAIIDRFLAVNALLVFTPLILTTAIAIKLTSPGPIFFRQPRTGWDGKVFLIWKFRSMKVHEPEEGGIKQATKDDDRVTSVGRFIRKTSIDELPQLFNVLEGNMSMVGPRPHAVQHNTLYSNQIKAYLCRHRIKPGITGLAQVRGYRGETEQLEQMSKRVESDLEYINNWSVSLDIAILFRTAFTLLSKQAY